MMYILFLSSQVGHKCMLVSHYAKAYENYSIYAEVCSILYGDNDNKTSEAQKLVQVSVHNCLFFV